MQPETERKKENLQSRHRERHKIEKSASVAGTVTVPACRRTGVRIIIIIIYLLKTQS